jgi:hypothetical protein
MIRSLGASVVDAHGLEYVTDQARVPFHIV